MGREPAQIWCKTAIFHPLSSPGRVPATSQDGWTAGLRSPSVVSRPQQWCAASMNPALGPAQQQPASSELAAALGACRRAFVATAVFSGMSNLLMLTGALFMLEVYDRILPSRSVPTLVALLFL